MPVAIVPSRSLTGTIGGIMQSRVLLGSTCALMMGLSGLAYAGDDHSSSAANNPPAGVYSSVTRDQIAAMQRALIARNLYQGKADGVWGPKTESAVRNFQTQSGLEATGA